MGIKNEKNILIEGLFNNFFPIKDSLNEEWDYFNEFLLSNVLRLNLAEDEDEELYVMSEIITGGLHSPAASHFENILNKILEFGRLPREKLVLSMEMAAKGNSDYRYLNIYFSDSHDVKAITPDSPLINNTVYHLHLDINPERRGLGEDDTPFPAEVLDEHWNDQDYLPLTINASSRDFEIQERIKILKLPREGPSEIMYFAVKPVIPEGTGYLQVDVLYNGQMLQSKQIEAYIVPTIDKVLEPSKKLLQTARTTFTANKDLMLHKLDRLPDRVFTINVEKDLKDESLDFRFLDNTEGHQEIAFYDTRLISIALKTAVEDVRRILGFMVTGVEIDGDFVEGYQWKLKDDGISLSKWLQELAVAGRYLYRAILPESQRSLDEDQGERLRARLKPGTVIQINPVVGLVTIPWALLYERKVRRGLDTKLCDEYKTCGPNRDDCPYVDNASIVCPYAFWGYRYAIEQIPCWVSGNKPDKIELIREISNDIPLNLNFNVYRDFNLWESHLEKLNEQGELHQFIAEEISQLEDTWEDSGSNLDIIYFYSHGGVDNIQRKPYIMLSDGRIDSSFLESCKMSWTHNPLVFLNGCSTGDYGPDSYVSLIDDFRSGGASGVIGTECPVPELFAEAFASALFPRLFSKEFLGSAMLNVRLNFLREYGNPLGLVYSLYAAHEITLSKSVKKGRDIL